MLGGDNSGLLLDQLIRLLEWHHTLRRQTKKVLPSAPKIKTLFLSIRTLFFDSHQPLASPLWIFAQPARGFLIRRGTITLTQIRHGNILRESDPTFFATQVAQFGVDTVGADGLRRSQNEGHLFEGIIFESHTLPGRRHLTLLLTLLALLLDPVHGRALGLLRDVVAVAVALILLPSKHHNDVPELPPDAFAR